MATFLFVVDVVVAALFGLKLMQAKTADASRGTNCVTRFMRDVGANTVYTRCVIICGGTTIVMFIIGMIAGCFWVCLPTLIPIGISVYFKVMSNRNAQRVKDARVVTKTTGKVAAVTGTAVAAAGLTVATGGIAAGGMAAAATVGGTAAAAGASRVLDKAMDQMDDVEGPNITSEDFKELNAFASKFSGIDIEHPEEFLATCQSVGIPTEGRDLGEIAYRVIECAPAAALEQLPENMRIEEKAMRIMKGALVCEENVV